MPLGRLRAFLAWLWSQATAFVGNIWEFVSTVQIDTMLPPSIRDPITWAMGMVPKAFGVRDTTPEEQIKASAVMMLFAILTSLLTFGATLALIAVFGITMWVGIFRWLPAFNEMWRMFRSKLPIKRDYDVPRWKEE